MSFNHGSFFFFFNDTATTEIYPLSLHDALPISKSVGGRIEAQRFPHDVFRIGQPGEIRHAGRVRSEEHTSELQSQSNLVCRLLLEKKKKHIHYARRAYSADDAPVLCTLSLHSGA